MAKSGIGIPFAVETCNRCPAGTHRMRWRVLAAERSTALCPGLDLLGADSDAVGPVYPTDFVKAMTTP
jgi:hypothetical protein